MKKTIVMVLITALLICIAPTGTAYAKTPTAQKKETQHEKMVRWDTKFQKLSDKNRKKFIKYWIKFYQTKLRYKNKDMPRKACAISKFETSLGRAGVGKSKHNLFGLKMNHKGKYVNSYKQKSYRLSCKALVLYYSKGYRWHLWNKL